MRGSAIVYLLHIETDCGNGGDHLAHLQAIQNGGLAGTVQAQDQDTHLTAPEESAEVAHHSTCNVGHGISDESAVDKGSSGDYQEVGN